MKRNDLQKLTRLRLKEAKVLLRNHCPEGAYYIAGYAVECAIKACIAKRTERFDFPDKRFAERIWNHDLAKLITAAGLDEHLKVAKRESRFDDQWAVVTKWNPESRYEQRSRAEAEALIRALENREHGVLKWLKHLW